MQIYNSSTYVKGYTFLGVIGPGGGTDGWYPTEQRNKFSVGEEIEIMKPGGENVRAAVRGIRDERGNPLQSAPHPKQKLWVSLDAPAQEYDILRRKEQEKNTC